MNLPTWTREPLVHFLIGGALLFGWFTWQGSPVDPASRSIIVDRDTLGSISAGFEQQMGRFPSDTELDNLIERHIREEVLYREALRLGMDQDDAVIRRRLAQKMDLVAGSQAELLEPSDEVLTKWLAEHPARFAQDPLYSFEQLGFVQRTTADAALKTEDLASRLETAAPTMELPKAVSGMSRQEIQTRFGQQFVRELDQLEPGDQWQGPVPSGLGWHLVRLQEVSAENLPALDDIRDDVESDWRLGTAANRKQQAYQLLRGAYSVEIDR
ncbi:MAG: peptidylprolyl isomerase [Erythrobacter sp.]